MRDFFRYQWQLLMELLHPLRYVPAGKYQCYVTSRDVSDDKQIRDPFEGGTVVEGFTFYYVDEDGVDREDTVLVVRHD